VRRFIEAAVFGLSFSFYTPIDFHAGEDEGSMVFEIIDESARHIVTINLLVSGLSMTASFRHEQYFLLISDTSEYPDYHTYFSFTPDDDSPTHIQNVIENISSERPEPICGAINRLLNALDRSVGNSATAKKEADPQEMDETEDEEIDSDDYDAYDEYFNPGMQSLDDINRIGRLKR